MILFALIFVALTLATVVLALQYRVQARRTASDREFTMLASIAQYSRTEMAR